MATNNARDNLKKRDYFARFGIAEGLAPSRRGLSIPAPHDWPASPLPTPKEQLHETLTHLSSPGSPWLSLSVAPSRRTRRRAPCSTTRRTLLPIHAKLKYTTLIEVPATEKIMEAATGDKDFWIVDVVGNFCFVHPAKAGISSNLNLITDKGNIYRFTLQDVSGTSDTPDLKVIVEPADRSSIVAASGPPQFVPAAQLEQSKQQLAAVQAHVTQAVDEYKSAYPLVAQVRLHLPCQ